MARTRKTPSPAPKRDGPRKKNGTVSRSAPTRGEIVTTAMEIVRSEGSAALSMGRLGREMGLTAAGLRSYFRERDDVLRAMIEALVMREELHIEAGAGEDPRNILRFLVEDTFRGYFEEDVNLELSAALLGEVVANPALLEPLEHLAHAIEPQLAGLKDSATAYIIHLALDGLRFDRIIGWGFLPVERHEAVRRRLLEMIDTV